MGRIGREKIWQAVSCLVCMAVLESQLDTIGASEFRGGSLTGPLFTMAALGSLLFLVASLLTFILRRIAATITLAATLLCFPLYLYSLMPGPYRWVFRGSYSVPLQRPFEWSVWGVAGVVSLLLAAGLSFRGYSSFAAKNIPRPEEPGPS